jgi:hypothetical protein
MEDKELETKTEEGTEDRRWRIEDGRQRIRDLILIKGRFVAATDPRSSILNPRLPLRSSAASFPFF